MGNVLRFSTLRTFSTQHFLQLGFSKLSIFYTVFSTLHTLSISLSRSGSNPTGIFKQFLKVVHFDRPNQLH